MKKIKQLSFVLFIFSVLAFSYPVTQVFAQGGGQCDSNPACNPASGTCCGQCDPGPACNPNDPNALPCCSLEGNSGSQPQGGHEPSGHPGTPNDLSPRLVKQMKKMSQELKECQSLNEELHQGLESASQQQKRNAPQPRQTPRSSCQPNTATKRLLDAANSKIQNICSQLSNMTIPGRSMRQGDNCQIHINTRTREYTFRTGGELCDKLITVTSLCMNETPWCQRGPIIERCPGDWER